MPRQATDERSRPPEPRFHFRRNRCSTSRNPCSTSRNRCSTSAGIDVPLPPDSVFHFRRNTQPAHASWITSQMQAQEVHQRDLTTNAASAPTRSITLRRSNQRQHPRPEPRSTRTNTPTRGAAMPGTRPPTDSLTMEDAAEPKPKSQPSKARGACRKPTRRGPPEPVELDAGNSAAIRNKP